MPDATMTPKRLMGEALTSLAAAGVDSPVLDAQLLLAHALSVTRAQLLLDDCEPLSDDAVERFNELLARRLAREPVAYILGEKHFRWITLTVDSRVLIPGPRRSCWSRSASRSRPARESSTWEPAAARSRWRSRSKRPDLEIWGTDVSPGAIAVAQANAERLGLKVSFVHGDLLEGLPVEVDAIIANLPYVAEGTPLAPEISRYEPQEALFAGTDGLAVIERLLAAAAGTRMIALEIGVYQAPAVTELFAGRGYRTEVYRDLAGIERVVVGRR